jgi:hypothetical protein
MFKYLTGPIIKLNRAWDMLGGLEKYLQGIHVSVWWQKCNKELSNEFHGAESLLELIKNFPVFLCNHKVNYCVQQQASFELYPDLQQSSEHLHNNDFFKMYVNIVLLLMSTPSKELFLSDFRAKLLHIFRIFACMLHVTLI